MMKTLNCFDITIISVMLTISTSSSRSFVVIAVMCFSIIQVISTGTWELVENECKMSIREVLILCGKHYLRSLITSQSLIQKIVPSSEILSSSTSNQYVFNQWKSITQRQLIMEWYSCTCIGVNFFKFVERTSFLMRERSFSSHHILCSSTGNTSSKKQSGHEIQVFGGRSRDQN